MNIGYRWPTVVTAQVCQLDESGGYLTEREILNDEMQKKLDNWFEYHKPTDGQPELYERLRSAGKQFATVICECTPASADQTAAIRKVREAVMTANAAIACDGEPLLAEWQSNGVHVMQRPDDSQGILRISIGGGKTPIPLNYCVFRGARGACIDLLRKALKALKEPE